VPIISAQDARELDSQLHQFFYSNSDQRPRRLRQIFTEKFDFNPSSGKVSLGKAPKNVTLPPDADRIASIEGVNIVYIPLQIPGTTRVRKAEAVAAAKIIASQLGDDMLLLFTNESDDGSVSQFHVILPTFTGSTPSLRRMVIERDLPRRTVLQQLSNIYHEWQGKKDLRLALERAFDVEAVTKAFFEQYRVVFEYVMGIVKGFQNTDEGNEQKKLYVQTLFNRLMFIYFLSRKGWLKFGGNPDYLSALWYDYLKNKDKANFYTERLYNLFFVGLNNPRAANLIKDNPALHALIGDVPFLNGGLFNKEELDEIRGIEVPDEAISRILNDLFERYNFTVMESTPLDQEVAVDPEMLGKVFEELVTGRHETGSYYTPRPVVAFMCREALKGYLKETINYLSAEAISKFVDNHDVSGLTLASAESVRKSLEKIKVVDPACGSGAYLLGMMHELVDLETALYSEKLVMDPKSLYDLKLRVIEENVYGADIDKFAVNIAMLRLWLSLSIEYESYPPPPLPNLDFKIVCGDSLTAPDPNPSIYGASFQMFREQVRSVSEKIAYLKHQHMVAIDNEKLRLAINIQNEMTNLKAALAASTAPEDAVDWRVVFAEVFNKNNGFDIAVANPPYVNMVEMDITDPTYRNTLRDCFTSAKGGFDLFIPFMERGLQMIKTGGMLVFIVPNKVLSAEYAREIRSLFIKSAPPNTLVDISSVPIFEASVYPVVIIATKTEKVDINHLVSSYQAIGESAERLSIESLGNVPLSIVKGKGGTWSPLLAINSSATILLRTKTLKTIADLAIVKGACTVSEAYEWKKAIINNGKELALNIKRYSPFLVSGNIKPFRHTWETQRVRYINDTYQHPVIDKNHRVISLTRRHQIESSKVIISGMAKRPTCVWDNVGIAAGKSTVIVIPNEGVNGQYLTCVINSEIMRQLYLTLFGSLSLAGGYLRFGPPQIRALPIAIPSDSFVDRVCNLAEKLNNVVDDGIYDEIIEEINALVLSGY
jgi:type I restriction-modification system DNA methylase subunit